MTVAIVDTMIARRHCASSVNKPTAATVATAHGAVALFLEAALRNVAARGLYDAMGFAFIGQRRRYYAEGEDALVLRKAL